MAGKLSAIPPNSERGKIAIDSDCFFPMHWFKTNSFKNIENSPVYETKGEEINAACLSMFSIAIYVIFTQMPFDKVFQPSM